MAEYTLRVQRDDSGTWVDLNNLATALGKSAQEVMAAAGVEIAPEYANYKGTIKVQGPALVTILQDKPLLLTAYTELFRDLAASDKKWTHCSGTLDTENYKFTIKSVCNYPDTNEVPVGSVFGPKEGWAFDCGNVKLHIVEE